MIDQPLRLAIEAALGSHTAAFVLQGIGSLSVAQLRHAGVEALTTLRGDLEILTIAGSLAPDGAHLHMAVSGAGPRLRRPWRAWLGLPGTGDRPHA